MGHDGVLTVEELRLHFRTTKGPVQAVDDVSLTLRRGRTLVVVGESGCGKSSLARAILRLLPRNVHTYSGRIRLNGSDVMAFPEERFRREVRWVRLALVPQGAMNALNPVLRVGEQVAEPLVVHGRAGSPAEARRSAAEIFRQVGVPLDFLDRYPFELSGGMRQRVAIAMALVTLPDVVLLDEPTSALDVLTQANIMNVLKAIKRDMGTSFILITHDIATSSEIADDAAVMYAGQIVEASQAAQFYREPLHPYSRALMASVPTLRQTKALGFIPGRPPSLIGPPPGCRFADRCPARFSRCNQEPPLLTVEGQRQVKCWLYA
ncbi:MAG: ABC transporter ATP-binding protein [Armatimonadota bacterium]|nr:ABC transporter ATP-binding protein [Armatimonadota bacterium]MDR7464567.1 ABC transporter ATP-binding protein [Armatimonadota bacterium]MDR7469557.1 ABC transporter ATP-binding protein [Armatimonadota bacterium]MDR7473435.1 ABC transporter ATP-binding protein [Armatimonadota bacterium]MDR7540256.1 ABC transporter ATP-binding protein [Armatimonadota bacterium]